MMLETLRIENFRSFKDETIHFDDYTCLVGANGAGKSSILTALNVFFRNTASSATNVVNLSTEDFHHSQTDRPVKITLTFTKLSEEAQNDLKAYYRQDKFIVSAKAVWDEATQAAPVQQYGIRMVMQGFARYFEAVDTKKKAAELQAIYDEIRERYDDLPSATTGPARLSALRNYEESHPELCGPIESANQFFGFTKGANVMEKHLQWVYVPAVKDASDEQDENSKTALGQILERTIRTKVNFSDSIRNLKDSLQKDYQKLLNQEQQVLTELQSGLQSRLRDWANPDATLQLAWHYDPQKTVVVNEPIARASVGEDDFLGEVARLGHGMQRAFLVSLLHELANAGPEGGPTLLLGFEEPELYQHPPQASHMASVLESLTQEHGGNAQIVVSTHSPYFVSAPGFERVRMVRKHHVDKCSLVAHTTFAKVQKRISDALGDEPPSPTVMMAKLEQIMQPSQREMYFTRFAVIVEGIEDVAFISTHLHVTKRWIDFRRLGCHFVVAAGKTNVSRPLAIASELCIRRFVVFDGDGNDKKHVDNHRRDNICLLRLSGVDNVEPFPAETLWRDDVVMWPTCIFDAVRDDVGTKEWADAEAKARENEGYINGVKQKNNLLIAAVIQELAKRDVYSDVLTRLCDSILERASRPLE